MKKGWLWPFYFRPHASKYNSVYTALSLGGLELHSGCLKHTLNVVFETLSCGTCGCVSLIFLSTVLELETVLQWLVSYPSEQRKDFGASERYPLPPLSGSLVSDNSGRMSSPCSFSPWEPVSSSLPPPRTWPWPHSSLGTQGSPVIVLWPCRLGPNACGCPFKISPCKLPQWTNTFPPGVVSLLNLLVVGGCPLHYRLAASLASAH